MARQIREVPEMLDLVEALGWFHSLHPGCLKRTNGCFVAECTLPLDMETAIGLQILGDWAVSDPDLELTILASLGKRPERKPPAPTDHLYGL